MKAKLHKRTVRKNRGGKWRGYEGGRWVCEFAFDSGVRVCGPAQSGMPTGSDSEMPKAAREWINAKNRVRIVVRGGVAEVAECSPGVSVTVIDFDNDGHQ